MGRRLALAVAGVLVLVGCLGLLTAVPAVQRALSPDAEPTPLPLRLSGQRYDNLTVDVDPGRYAIWATRPTSAPDRDRCRVTGPDGRPVPAGEPGHVVRWTEVATDDTLWTWVSTFAAPAAGRYRLTCRLDPDVGQQYTVTREPDRRLTLRLRLALWRGLLVAALPAGLVILGMTLTWRRRAD
ncbi:hypothetical protein AB0F68_01185 [Micromonospora sp. NPDC023966]|uniref:hypothetical protein n=1 Tax=Micromonospora sp. NPDC023966 TaxID=3154699 RepID=UPI0034009C4C